MTPEDQALPAWTILLDGKHEVGRVVASNAAEASRQARNQFPTYAKRLSARREEEPTA